MENERRSRVVSFRLSGDEFEQLKIASDANGARSVSDFARSAMGGVKNLAPEELEAGIKELLAEVRQLCFDIRKLTETLHNQRATFTEAARTERDSDRSPYQGEQ